MPDYSSLIKDGKYREAGKALDAALAGKGEPNLFYLRALVSCRMKNYEFALEMVERALDMRKDSEYVKLKGLILFEMFEFGEALEAMKEVLETRKDAEAYFICAICLMFMDDKRSRDYLQLAYLANRQKTRLLIAEFYDAFFRSSLHISKKDKKALEARIAAIK